MGGQPVTDITDVVIAPTITKLPDCAARVLVTGSHGGQLCGELALAARVRAALFHDAGVGMAQAGIAALHLLDQFGIAAATAGHNTCRVGDANDLMARGRISHANNAARAVGVTQDMPCRDAAQLLRSANFNTGTVPASPERRVVQHPDGAIRPIVLIDSASMVDPATDRGAIIVTGSHGGLVGGDPALALRVDGFAAAYNDAGIGIDDAGIARLPALDRRGIAAVTVAAASARIGEAQSTFEGQVSAVNECARRLGADIGIPLAGLLVAWSRLAADVGNSNAERPTA